MLKQLALAAFAAVALSAASAHALPFFGNCPNSDCGMNGTQLTGIAGQTSDDSERFEGRGGCDEFGCGMNGTRVDGRLVEADQPAVNAIILPTGEILDLR